MRLPHKLAAAALVFFGAAMVLTVHAQEGQKHQVAGIGAAIHSDVPGKGHELLKQGALVEEVLPKSPAEKVGLKAQDKIIAVDGEKLAGLRLHDAVENHLRGPLGSVVKLTVMRPGQSSPLTFVVVRDIVPVPPSKDK